MQKEGIDVKLAASLSAAGIGSVSTEYQHKTDEESQNKFERAVENTVYSTVGSKPPSDGDLFAHFIAVLLKLHLIYI